MILAWGIDLPTCVVLDSSSKHKLIYLAKTKTASTWVQLARRLNCSRSLLFAYLRNVNPSSRNFKRLCKLAGLDVAELRPSYIQVHNEPRSVVLPTELDGRLSELLGVIAGDGHVSRLKYQVHICGHKQLDRAYIVGHVAPLVTSLFRTTPFIRTNKATVYCRFYSKPVVLFFGRVFKIPIGKKKGRLRIPQQIRQNQEFLTHYLRGLFDTDGSIYRHHQSGLALDITSASPDFRADVVSALIVLGFHPKHNGKNVQLYRQSEIKRFFEVVKPANEKHLIKYWAHNRLGYLPKAQEIFAAVV